MRRNRRLGDRATAAAYIEAARRHPQSTPPDDVVAGALLGAYERDLGRLVRAIARLIALPPRKHGLADEWKRRGVAVREAYAQAFVSRSRARGKAHALLISDVDAPLMDWLEVVQEPVISGEACRGEGSPSEVEAAL